MKRKRFFSGVYERLALWLNSKGICQECGAKMSEWHADHIVPFSRGGETVLENGRAVCPPCNLKKGARMVTGNSGFQFTCNNRVYRGQDLSQIPVSDVRPGIRRAVRTVLDLITDGKRKDGTIANKMSVVLPTRYGKSDAIRLLAMYSRSCGIGGSLVLSPSEYLRSQICSAKKVADMAARYGFEQRIANTFGEICSKAELAGEALSRLVLGSSTIQMIGATKMVEPSPMHGGESLLCHTMKQVAAQCGGKILVMIDEAHECGEALARGKMVEELTKAGCIIVLFTATPYRTDGDRIPGMREELLDQDTVNRFRIVDEDQEKGLVLIEQNQIDRIRYRLIPDVEVTFREAWEEKTKDGHPILCDLDHQSIAIILEDETLLSTMVNTVTGKPVNSARIKSLIGASINGPSRALVYQKGAEKFVTNIRLRRGDWPLSAGIVYAGNDYNEEEDDRKLKEIGRKIEREWVKQFGCQPKYEIVTGNNPNASMNIRHFAEDGKYDFLICKQMGSAGLDSPRIKTLLDLSPVRTFASCIQRWMRVATPKYFAAGSLQKAFTGTVITLDDPLTNYIWGIAITAEGGEHPGNIQSGDPVLIQSYWKEKDEPTSSEQPSIDGVTEGGVNDNKSGEMITDPYLLQLAANIQTKVPHFLGEFTTASVVRMMMGDGPATSFAEKRKTAKSKAKAASGADREVLESKEKLIKAIKEKCNYVAEAVSGYNVTDAEVYYWQPWVRSMSYLAATKSMGIRTDKVRLVKDEHGFMRIKSPSVTDMAKNRETDLMNKMTELIGILPVERVIEFKRNHGG